MGNNTDEHFNETDVYNTPEPKPKNEEYKPYERVATTTKNDHETPTAAEEKKQKHKIHAPMRQQHHQIFGHYDSHFPGSAHGSIYSIRSQHEHSFRSISHNPPERSIDSTRVRSLAGYF